MRKKHYFELQLHPNWKFHKFKYFKGLTNLYFTSIPTTKEALKVFDLEEERMKKEHDWINKEYDLNIIESPKQIEELKRFTKACRDLLVKYGVNKVKNWDHVSSSSNIENEGTIRLFKKYVYVTRKS